MSQHFSPLYTDSSGRIVALDDSVEATPEIAITLLQGLALPKDMEQVPKELKLSLVDMCERSSCSRLAVSPPFFYHFVLLRRFVFDV